MSVFDEGKKALAIAATGLHGLETIGNLVRPLLQKQPGIDVTMNVLHTVLAIVDSIQKGFDGEISVESVQSEIDKLHGAIADNDRRVDADLDAKFPR